MMHSAFRTTTQQLLPALSRLSLASKPPSVPKEALAVLKNSPNAYALFMSEHLKGEKRNTTDRMKNIAQEWRQMSEQAKKPFVDKAAKAKQLRETEIKKIPTGKLQELMAAAKSARVDNANKRSKRQATKASNKLDAPKRPLSPYTLYVQANMGNVKDFKDAVNNMKRLAQQWKQLSEQEKAAFENKSEQLKKDLPQQVQQWQQAVLRQHDEATLYAAMQRPHQSHLILEGQKIPDQFLLPHNKKPVKKAAPKKAKKPGRLAKKAKAKPAKAKAAKKKTTATAKKAKSTGAKKVAAGKK